MLRKDKNQPTIKRLEMNVIFLYAVAYWDYEEQRV